MVELASEYDRYGYRRITAMLCWEGWRVNHKRVEPLWRREGLKVPARQPKRKRLWVMDLVFGCVPPSKFMSGATTLFMYRPMMDGHCGCSQ